MDQHKCACCGAVDGQAYNDVVRRLHEVEIMSKFAAPSGEETSIVLCSVCVSRMPFNIGPLVEEANVCVDRSTADDVMLTAFLTRFMSEVWPEDEPPSTMLLVRLLNAVGLRTPRGGRWEYHNLNQRLTKLDIDKAKITGGRAKATFHERLGSLMQTASQWAANQYAGGQAQAGDGESRERLDGWSPPEPIGPPEGLPGLEPCPSPDQSLSHDGDFITR